MPLPIRDGNQSLTTLSTILVSNSHIPAHTVISFGTQGITDIATAVSGVELGPNTLNALENITVTLGQVTITGGLTDTQLRASAVTIGGVVTATISGTPSVTFGTAVITGSTSIIGTATITGSTSILNFPATQTVTFSQASVTFGTAVITGSTSIIGTPSVTFTQIATHGVTIGAGTAQIGSVTASISGTPSITFGTAVITGSTSILNFPVNQSVTFSQASVTFGTAVITGSTSIIGTPSVTFTTATITGSTSILNFPATQTVTFTQASVTFGTAVITGSTNIIGTASVTFTQIATHGVTVGAGTAQIGSVTASISGTVPISISSVTIGNSVTIGSLPAISGTVTANTFAVQGTSVTTSNFTSTTASTVLASFNATREVLTIFNEGAGNLHICAGATCTTIAYQVRLSSGDYYEVPNHQTTITHSAVYATAGTARICQLS